MAGEDILHYAGIRLRLQGAGNLIPTFLNLDDSPIQVLTSINMSALPTREPLRLSNFTGQRVRLKLSTSLIDEKMIVNRIVFFVKPLWTEYPG